MSCCQNWQHLKVTLQKKTSSCRCHKGNPNCVTFEFFPSVPWPYRNRFFRQSKTSTRTSRGVATDHEKEKTWISLISRNFLWKEILKQLKIFEKTHLNEFPASQMSQRMRKRKKERKKEKERLWKSVFKKTRWKFQVLDRNFTWQFFVGASWPRRWSASSDTRTSATARRKPSMASSRGRPGGRFNSFDGRKEVVGTEFGRISVEDVFFHGNGLSSDVLSLGESCNHNVFWKVVRMPWWSWPPAPENHWFTNSQVWRISSKSVKVYFRVPTSLHWRNRNSRSRVEEICGLHLSVGVLDAGPGAGPNVPKHRNTCREWLRMTCNHRWFAWTKAWSPP